MSRNTAGGYHGSNRKGPYFEGWYLKFQTGDGKALALIPAVHTDRQGHRTASLQVLTRARSWWLEYPEGQFQAARDQPGIRLGKNFFTPSRISLHVERDGLSLHGTILCGPFTTTAGTTVWPPTGGHRWNSGRARARSSDRENTAFPPNRWTVLATPSTPPYQDR